MLIRESDAAEWTKAVAEFPGATLFHEPAWLAKFAELRGSRLRWFALENSTGVLAVVPLVLRRTPLGNTVNVLPFPYLGPLYRPGSSHTVLESLPGVLAQVRPIKARMTIGAGNTAEPTDLDLAAHEGFTTDFTYVVNLVDRNEDDFRAAMSSSWRKALNFAVREGVEVRQLPIDVVAETVARLHADVYGRQGLSAEYSEGELVALATDAAQWAAVRASIAYVNGQPRAAQIALLRGDVVYNWVGAAHRDRGVMNLVEWETLRWAQAQGARLIDLVGAPTPGVAAFKTGFGATPRAFCVYDSESRRYRFGVTATRRLASLRTRSDDAAQR